ncbi:MAG TPA: hypothetical protein PKA90_10495 [Ignavibacteria bacterium]|nr:hypothetical protein [Ignavibacteria bacterium]HMR40846.1 hypothetical protein [Ignavibacteria bacterium]
MKTQWFKKSCWIFIPASVTGIIIYMLTFAFCITVFVAIDRHSHSASDTLYGIFPYFMSAFTLLFWIASNTCADRSTHKNEITSE